MSIRSVYWATSSVLLALQSCAVTPEKASIENIECELNITARQAYFGQIEGIVEGYAIQHEGGAWLEKEPPTPQAIVGGIGVFQQTLFFVMPNPKRWCPPLPVERRRWRHSS